MASGEEAAVMRELDAATGLFPLTFPIPSPGTHADLLPAADLPLEQELLRNPDNARSWLSYISHVEESNYRKRPMPDADLSSAAVRMLGLLSDASQRTALQRIVSVYERALAHFPTSYRIWSHYLNARARFVLGDMRGGEERARRRMLETGRSTLDMGPSLLDARKEEEQEDVWDGGLDGIIGWREWHSLAAAYERALMWLPTMPRLWLSYLALFAHPKCPPTLARTHARRTFDRALRTLPGSLHLRIWKVYLRWAELVGGQVAQRIWRRYLQVDPSLSERYVALLSDQSPLPRYADGERSGLAPESVSSSAAAAGVQEEGEEEEEEAEEEDEVADEVGGDDAPAHTVASAKRRRILEAAKVLHLVARRARAGTYTSPDGKSPFDLLIEWLELVERFPEQVGMSREEERELGEAAGDAEAASNADAGHGKEVAQESEDDADLAVPLTDASTAAAGRMPVRRVIMRDGLRHFPDQAGRLWTGLATYWIKRGDLETAQATFEEGMKAVMTVRDFTQIFDAYAETSENVVSFMMQELEEEGEEEEGEERAEQEAELDRRMEAFETLMERRPFLVNDVLLRRNPDDVQEWEKRVALWGENDEEVIATYKTAVDTINPRKATANLHQLFLHFARFYEDGGAQGRRDPDAAEHDVASARVILERAVKVPYRRVDDLAEVWCSWAEMEVRNGNYDEALRVMVRATSPAGGVNRNKSISYFDETLAPQTRLFKSLKLWSFYADLEESLGTRESAKRAFDRIMELKIANAQVIINYALFLEEQEYFEEAFKVYERGVDLFTYPVAFELWNVYLSKFVRRYGGTKLERARDLFEQALDKCPAKFCKVLFLRYGKLEEEHGLVRKAMAIYERATRAVAIADRYEMYLYYIAKATANYGLAATRPIYEAAIEALPDRQATAMCLRFAQLERKLGEIDRARAIYAHASQFCNPRTEPEFWKVWNTFEIETGTEDTFREMLRIKRSVQAQFNTDASYIASTATVSAGDGSAAGTAPPPSVASANPMEVLDAQSRAADAARGGALAADAARGGAPAFVAATQPTRPAEAGNAEQVGAGDDDELL
ncbi:pre-mRNA-splicing factor syf1 [Malassezia sp. CBS 17886]|nr:pre-mRNA-splicing factor syf1 [Malassezia sp. CBS 17886]